MADRHECEQLKDHKRLETVALPDTNASQADAIEKYKGRWYLVVNLREYNIEIKNCPYCGQRLN